MALYAENTKRPDDFIPPYEVTYNRQYQTIKIGEWEFTVEMLVSLMTLPIGATLKKGTATSFTLIPQPEETK